MAWVKLDDLMPEHPKILALSDACFRAYVSLLCWCSRNLTDGYIPDAALATIGVSDKGVIRELSRARLWKRQGRGGWQIHDFLDYNPSRAHVLAQRQQKADAGRKGGQAAAIARATAVATPSGSSPVPSRPVRSTIRSVGKEEEKKKKDRSVEAKPSIREPGTSPDPPAITDDAPQSPSPTDRPPPPAVQDGGNREMRSAAKKLGIPICEGPECACGGTKGTGCPSRTITAGQQRLLLQALREEKLKRETAASRPAYGVTDATRQVIADLLGYPPAGKKITAMLTGQIEWCAGATEAHWLEMIERANNGKSPAEVQDDGSVREGWVRTTMRGIVEGRRA